MNFKSILLIVFLITIILEESSCQTCKQLEPSKEACTSYTNFTDYEKRVGDSCCLVTYGDGEDDLEEECQVGNKDEVEDALKLGKALFEVYEIDCSSKWLYFGFYVLFLVFLF